VSSAPPARLAVGRGRVLRAAALVLWLSAIAAYAVVLVRTGTSPVAGLRALLDFVQAHPLGVAAFVLVYALRPLLLVSAALLTVGAGILYGPGLGFVVVVLGANAGALLAYALARALGADLAGRALGHPRLRGMTRRLRANAFEAVLTLRLLFAPYDAVSYLAGALRLGMVPFLLATALGSLPGTLVFLLFGAGLADLTALDGATLPRVDGGLLLASAGALVTSLLLARLWRRREARRSRAEAPAAPAARPQGADDGR
jgi:uncharacterized membrane protein YdjX (TVP38/TMEM64 family)